MTGNQNGWQNIFEKQLLCETQLGRAVPRQWRQQVTVKEWGAGTQFYTGGYSKVLTHKPMVVRKSHGLCKMEAWKTGHSRQWKMEAEGA